MKGTGFPVTKNIQVYHSGSLVGVRGVCVCTNFHGYCQGGVGLLQLHFLWSYHTSNTRRRKGKVQSSFWRYKDTAV